MRLTDRLIKSTDRKNKQSPYDDNEETMMYMQRARQKSINDDASPFDSAMQIGINTDKSAFDKSAVFNTKSSDDNHLR